MMRKRTRQKEQRIIDPATHPRRYVGLTVAAEYLEVDRRTLAGWLDEGKLPFSQFGTRRKIEMVDLLAFERRVKQVAQAS